MKYFSEILAGILNGVWVWIAYQAYRRANLAELKADQLMKILEKNLDMHEAQRQRIDRIMDLVLQLQHTWEKIKK